MKRTKSGDTRSFTTTRTYVARASGLSANAGAGVRAKAGLLIAALATVFSATCASASFNSSPTFAIKRFSVEGNTLLPAASLDTLLAAYTGPSRDFSDVQRAREALLEAYRRQGYTTIQVQLPEQELNDGVVRFSIIETRIGKVTVEGNKYFGVANVRRSLPGLQEGTVPNLNAISASLKAANESPARQLSLKLSSYLEVGSTNVDATITVADEKAWRVGLTADNTGSAETGRTHVGVLYQYANLWDRDHLLSLQYTTTAEEPAKVAVYGVGYHVPLYANGDSLDFYGSYSDVDSGRVSAGLFDLNVSGKGTVYGARYNQRLARHGAVDSRVVYGLENKAFKNDVLLGNFQLGNDVTVHPFSITYGGNTVADEAGGGEFSFYVSGVRNISGGSHGSEQDFARARSGARAGYSLLRYGLGYSRAFARDWQLRLMMNGQYTRDALITGEQFGAGGASSVRGFQEREVANDSGNFGSVEIYTPGLCGALPVQCRALAFVDSAELRRNKALPGEEKHTSIASAGLGLRFNAGKNISAQLDYGRVIDAGGSRATGDSRVHFNIALFY